MQQGLMCLFQSLGMVGLRQRTASVDRLKTYLWKNLVKTKDLLCKQCKHEHEIPPSAIRAFSPEMQPI